MGHVFFAQRSAVLPPQLVDYILPSTQPRMGELSGVGMSAIIRIGRTDVVSMLIRWLGVQRWVESPGSL